MCPTLRSVHSVVHTHVSLGCWAVVLGHLAVAVKGWPRPKDSGEATQPKAAAPQ